MIEIEIEFEEPHILECECCGKPVKRLTRFVYQDGDAFAVYSAQFTPSHEEKYAFSVHLWQDKNNWNTRVTDKNECPGM
jgi:hypothetical protein